VASPFEEGALGEVTLEGEVDHKTGLQSSSFIEESILKAYCMVSSKYLRPSMAKSCVVLVVIEVEIVPFTDCSSIAMVNLCLENWEFENPNIDRYRNTRIEKSKRKCNKKKEKTSTAGFEPARTYRPILL
jgi:hypothetical protein